MSPNGEAGDEGLERGAPLAARMRPRTLDEYAGQEHIVGPGRLLRRAIQADQLGSLIFYGPPGTGKTTLAQVIANTTTSHFIKLNAVLAGVKDIRAAIGDAQQRADSHRQRTILFVDEVHRFNKAQQDALLPWVENGTVIFIGATTENPYFEVNKALVSRSRIFQLQPLTNDHLRHIVWQTLGDPVRGYGCLNVSLDEDALDHLVEVANGDARAVLNALELAVETTGTANAGEEAEEATGKASGLRITLDIAEESIQQRAVLYDKEGDYHYDTISAFIKSLRGSDPDAAVYWMAKMLYAGESPRFIFRRMIIFASEDVGLADPNAVAVVTACADAFEYVGLPEGRFPLAQACLYLATAPKSNTAFAFFDAIAQVEKEGDSGVPRHLRDGSRDKKGFGHGEGYLYPHAYRDHWVAQQYLPASLQGKTFYEPSDQGYEAAIGDAVARRREAQLAAMLAAEAEDGPEIELLTFSPKDAARERWLQRTVSNAGERLGRTRDRVLESARLARHSAVLDLKASSGLLTWEALRRAPEGGVYALAANEKALRTMRQQAERLSNIERPVIVQGEPRSLPDLFDADLRFDAIVGYNALFDSDAKAHSIGALRERLSPDAIVSLAERIPRHTQRLHRLIDLDDFSKQQQRRIIRAEEAIYAEKRPLVDWDAADLVSLFKAEGFSVEYTTVEETSTVQVTDAVLARWFGVGKERPSYADRLAVELSVDELAQVKSAFERQLRHQSVEWAGTLLYLVANR